MPRKLPQRQHSLPQSEELKKWVIKLGFGSVLGPLIPTAADRLRVLQLLHQHRQLNKEYLRSILCTDIITNENRT